MPMPLPEERCYYYELRECGNVLLCWIPRRELEESVSAGRVDARILQDYPGGLDVEVTPADTSYLKKRYGFDLGRDPADLLLAFEAITASKEVDVEGEVSGAVVEDLARSDAGEQRPAWNPRLPVSKDQAEMVLKKHPAVQRRVDGRLRVLSGGARSLTHSAKAAAADVLQRIRRTKGDAPAVVFARLQRQFTKERS